MTLLSERQATAAKLARAIGAMKGAFVVSPLPLHPDANLRVHVVHPNDARVRAELEGWGWTVVDHGNTSRFEVSDGTMRLATILEVQIDKENSHIPTTEIVAQPKQVSREVEETLKALGYKR